MSVISPAQSELVDFYRDKLETISTDDPWIRGLKKVLFGEVFESSLFEYLVELCLEQSIETKQDFLLALHRHLYCILLAKCREISNQEALNKLEKSLKSLKIKAPLRWGKVSANFLSLIDLLCQTPEREEILQSSILIGDLFEEEKLPHPLLSAQQGSILSLIGILTEDVSLCHESLNIAVWHHNLVDKNGCPFRSLWLSQKEYCFSSLISWNYLLFHLHASFSPTFNELSEKMIKLLKLSDSQNTTIPYLPLLISHYFDQFIAPIKKIPDIKYHAHKNYAPSLNTYFHHDNKFSIASTFTGSATSLGAIHKDNVQITSFGPHYMPLGEAERFGIFRTCQGSSEDIFFEENYKVEGWMRLIDPNSVKPTPGNAWINHRLEKKEDALHLSASFYDLPEEETLSYVFFIKGLNAQINEKSIKPNSLDHYRDDNKEVVFKGENNTLTITPQFLGEMQVIPLAGSDHFWGSDFLLAFSIDPNNLFFKWIIK